MKRGLIEVYTGNGKGKTTAAVGLVLRALGHNFRVLLVQFLKSGKSGEIKVLKKYFADKVDVLVFPGKCPITRPLTKDELKNLKNLLFPFMKRVRKYILTKRYGLVVLDEINNCLKLGLVSKEAFLDMLKEKPGSVELVLTGRSCPGEIIEAADLCSEILELKHPYKRGIKSRAGIEF
jgi:cob(I)alamin adenosyltransferase